KAELIPFDPKTRQPKSGAKPIVVQFNPESLKLTRSNTFEDKSKGKEKNAEGSREPPKPNLCLFAWGAFQFTGMFESFNETLDFFSPGGKPLRATVAVSMIEDRFDYSAAQRTGPRDTKPPAFSPSGEDVPVAKTGGPAAPGAPGADPSSWRDTAMFNG